MRKISKDNPLPLHYQLKMVLMEMIENDYESKLLEQNDNALALLFSRITYMQNEIPIEYTKAINRSDKYKYEILLT